MPPKSTTGMPSGRIASRIALRSPLQENFPLTPGSVPRRACTWITMASVSAMRKPGRKPAMKSAAIERPDIAPRITITRQGGISMPMPEAAATIAAARSGG